MVPATPDKLLLNQVMRGMTVSLRHGRLRPALSNLPESDRPKLLKAKGESDMSGKKWTRNAKMALVILSVAVAACSPTPPIVEKPSADKTSGNTKPISTPSPKATDSSIPSFEGRIGENNEKKKFFDFLSDNERRVVKIDVNLSDEQMQALKEYPVGEKVIWIDLTYKSNEGTDEGAELLIDLAGGEKDFYFDERATSQRIQSYLKIVGIQGPQMGIFSIRAMPVAIESVR